MLNYLRTFIKILVLLSLSTSLSFGQVIDVSNLYSSNKFFFPNFEHLGEHTGLPHYRISSLIEDHEGYLWIGTNDGGLIKYDGYSFHSFEFDPTNQFSISSNNVYFVFEDSRNMLWVGTENALCYFHPYRRQFMKVQLQAADKSLIIPSDISCITEDEFGNLLLGTNIGIIAITQINKEKFLQQKSHEIFLNTVNAKAIRTKFYNEIHSTPGSTIQDMEFDPQGLLWILTKMELGVIDYPKDSLLTDSIKFSTQAFDNYKKVTEISSAREINIDGSGIVRVVTGESLYHIIHNRDTIEVKNFDFHTNIRNVEDFNKGYSSGKKFWIGYYRTDVKLYDDVNSEFYPLTFETNNISDLYDHGVTCFLKTRSNVIFIGTSWGGLFKFNQHSILSYFHPNLQNIHLKQTNNLRYVYEDSKGYLWILAKDIYKCNRNTGEIIETFTDGFFDQLWCYKNKLIEHSNGDIWIGTEGSGLISIDLNKKGEAIGSKKIFSDTTVTSISEDANGMVWVGTNIYDMNNSRVSSELFKINPDGKILNKHMIAQWKQRSDMQIDQFINQVYIDKKGIIWLATGFGLVKVSENPDKITRYLLPENSTTTKGQSKILSLSPDPNSPERFLWIGTSGGGLYSFDIERSNFIHTPETQGILSNHIASILSDDYGNLWLGTDVGLAKLTIEKDGGTVTDIQRFNNYDGLITNDYSNYYGHNAVKTKNGELIFTGPRGFHIIDPENVKTDSYIPPIHITNFYINHNPANFNLPGSPLDKPISMVKSLQLPHDKNSVEFEFTALDYKSPNNLKYAFILEHYDKDWIYYGNNRTIQYTKLPPGKYTLKAKVANRDGIWSNSFPGLEIQIYKPWWATFWAYVLYFVITGFVIWSIVKEQINRQKMKMKMEMKILEAKKFKELDSMKSMFSQIFLMSSEPL
ncbi:MAG: two-component regulator propeller domain-containing protein [Bacteroidales bacterium]